MPGDKTATTTSPKHKTPPNTSQRKSPKSLDPHQQAALATNVPITKNRRTDIIFKEGTRVEARDRIDNKWWTAKVLEVDPREKEVLIHFHGWNLRHDEWISMESQRLRPATKKNRRSRQIDVLNSDRASAYPNSHGGANHGGGVEAAVHPPPPPFKEFREGDEVMALWNKTKYPAKILRFEPDGSYLLEYYDGIKKKVLPKNIRKLTSEDAPFIKSCQEDLELLKEELRAAAGENQGAAGTRKRKAKFNVKEVLNIKTPVSASLDRNSSIDSPHSNRSASSISSRDSSSSSLRSTTNTSGNGNSNDALISTTSSISTNAHTTKQSKTKKNISQANNKSSKLLSTKKRQRLNEKKGAAVASDIVLNGGDKKSSLLDEKSSSNNDKSSLIHEKSSSNNENAAAATSSPSPKLNCDTTNADANGMTCLNNGGDKVESLNNGESKEETCEELNGFSHSKLTSEKENKFKKKTSSVGGTKRKSESQDIKTTEIVNSRKRKKLSVGQLTTRPKKAAGSSSRPVMTARDGSLNNQFSAEAVEKKPRKEKCAKNKIGPTKEDLNCNNHAVPDKDETKDISGAEVETRPAQFPYLSLDLNKSPESLKACLVEGVMYPGPGKPVSLRAPKLPEGWKKMVYVRTKGITNGKWDVYMESPAGEVFRSKMELSRYVEKKKLNSTLNIQDFDFVLDPAMKRIRSLWRQLIKPPPASLDDKAGPDEAIVKPSALPNGDSNAIIEDSKNGDSPNSRKRHHEDNSSVVSPSTTAANSRLKDSAGVCTTPSSSLPGNHSSGQSPEGSPAGVRCNLPECNKLFRNGTLLLQHVKHYHSYLTCLLEEYVGNSPTVTDMAYSRTRLGDSKQEFSSDTILLDVIAKAKQKYDKRKQTPDNNSTNRGSPGSTRSKRYASRQGHQPQDSEAPAENERMDIPESSSPSKSSQDNSGVTAAINKSSEVEQENSKSQVDVGSDSVQLPSTPLSTATAVNTSGASGQSSLRKNKRIFRQILQVEEGDGISRSVGESGQAADNQEKETCNALDGSTTNFQLQDSSRQLQDASRQLPPAKLTRQITPPTWKRRTRQSNSSRLNHQRATSGGGGSAAKLENDFSGGLLMADSSPSGLESSGGAAAVETMTEEELVQCLCRKVDGDGLMVQCEVCLSWQHGHCTGLYLEEQVPERYICVTCLDPPWGRGSTKYLVPIYYKNQDRCLPQLQTRTSTPAPAEQQPHLNQKRRHQKTVDVVRMSRLSKLAGLQNIVCQVGSLLHSLRTKLSIAAQPNHPKVFMWSALWEQTQTTTQPQSAVDNSLELFLAAAATAAGDAFGCETAAGKLSAATDENSGYNNQTDLQMKVGNKFLDSLDNANNHIGSLTQVLKSNAYEELAGSCDSQELAGSCDSQELAGSCDSQMKTSGDKIGANNVSSQGLMKGQDTDTENQSEALSGGGQNHVAAFCSGQEQSETSVDGGEKQLEAVGSGHNHIGAPSSDQNQQLALERDKEQLETLSSSLQMGTQLNGQEQLGAHSSGQEQLGAPSSGQEQLGAPSSGQEQLGALSSGQEQLGATSSGQGQLEILGSNSSDRQDDQQQQQSLEDCTGQAVQGLSLPDFDFPSLNEVAQLLPGVLQDFSQSIILHQHPTAHHHNNQQQQQGHTTAPQQVQQQHLNLIPEPKLIDREECRANLVQHIEFIQEELVEILDKVETEVASLEALDPILVDPAADTHLSTAQVCSGVVTRLILHLACIHKLASRSRV